MTAYLNNYKQTTAMYINIATVIDKIYDEEGNTASWAQGTSDISGALSTPGAAVFRDMGKIIYLPAGGACQSTILRKVQYVHGDCGTSGNTTNEYYTGYIRVGGQTYGGGDGYATPVARIA